MGSTSASSAAPSPGLPALDQASSPQSSEAPNQGSSHQAPTVFSSGEVEHYPNIHGLTGRSPAMRRLIQQMQRMAPHLSLATIEGEEGTGRTLAAHALHAAGPAPNGPFVPCPATQFFAVESGRSDSLDRPNAGLRRFCRRLAPECSSSTASIG